MIMNEKIKASEVALTGVDGEDLGIVATTEALRLAKELKVDLVCLSLTSSPPPCKLVSRGDYKNEKNKEKQQERKAAKGLKVKELKLSPFIEDHDYDTKKRQAERILSAGDAVQLIIQVEKKKTDPSKQLAQQLVNDLAPLGKTETGLQISGKHVIVVIKPS
ncbi:translation initiation factor IF-3 [Paenibacillus sp. N1-5-1-14]|uniref:translation initiation factor IF-3 n=1 Tax=Paenibacillus radicibacter TaxID=2972488 RepID=UPI002158E381|nr:translation initiation factor IF-3 [Paenibacillus radicibacter]MCR8644797.1 translation initiation factor IF-3 [Paenibacillus radicibacter]